MINTKLYGVYRIYFIAYHKSFVSDPNPVCDILVALKVGSIV